MFIKLFQKKFLLAISMILAICFPIAAQAGMLNSFFGNRAQAAESQAKNIPLLEAHLGLDPIHPIEQDSSVLIEDDALLPRLGPLGTEAEVAQLPDVTFMSTYVVRPGDTVSAVAELFNVTTGTVLLANNLSKGDTLRTGQQLVILPFSGVQHTVKKGDTIAKIAKTYGTDKDEIIKFNDISESTVLAAGNTILIPDVENEVLAQVTEAKKAKSAAKTGTVSAGKSKNTTSLPGYYIWPIEGGRGRVNQGSHGYRNNSVDLGGVPAGTNLVAAADGVVIVSTNSGWNGGYGNYMIIEHANGTTTIYGHMQRAALPVGTRVSQGQVIGTIGRTGNATGVHVHFEVRGKGNVINPGINKTWKW